MTMKSVCIHKHLAVTTVTALLALATAGAAGEVREEFHKTYPMDKNGKVQLENVNGSVHVRAWDRNEVKVDAIKKAKNQEQLDAVRIEVDASSDSVRIKTKYPEGRNKNSGTVDYTLTVPKESRLDKINTVNGAVEIQGVSGDVGASSVNGSVKASGMAGQVDLSTVNGSVSARVGALKEKVSLKSMNGSLALAVPPEANADVSASTVNGGISSDFSLPIKKHIGTGSKVDGKLGSGGPTIRLSNVNGGIRITKGAAAEAE